MCCLEEVYKCFVLCVLMVEGMAIIVNVMLSLMSVMNSPPAFCVRYSYNKVNS